MDESETESESSESSKSESRSPKINSLESKSRPESSSESEVIEYVPPKANTDVMSNEFNNNTTFAYSELSTPSPNFSCFALRFRILKST